jgi:hypothetical protein
MASVRWRAGVTSALLREQPYVLIIRRRNRSGNEKRPGGLPAFQRPV